MNLQPGQSYPVIRASKNGGSKLESLEYRGIEMIRGTVHLVFCDPSCNAILTMAAAQVSSVEFLQFEAEE